MCLKFAVSFPSQSLSFNLNIVLEMVNHWSNMHKVLSVVSSSTSMRVHTYAHIHTHSHVTSDTAGLPIFTLAGTPYPQQMLLKLNCIQALASAKLCGSWCMDTAKAPLVQPVCVLCFGQASCSRLLPQTATEEECGLYLNKPWGQHGSHWCS